MSTDERHTYTWRIVHKNDDVEDFTAYVLNFSPNDVATFHGYGSDGRWVALLTLAPGTYRSIRLMPNAPMVHGDFPPCLTCKDTGAVEVEGYPGMHSCPDCSKAPEPAESAL